MSINKIHVNSSTRMTLNDRFTAIQSTGPQIQKNSVGKKLSQRALHQNKMSGKGGYLIPKASLANRKFLERLEQKHKIQTALKLKRRSLKANMQSRQRIRNRIGLKKGAAAKAIRITPTGRLIRSNSLSNIATMKADLVVGPPALKRSNSASNLASRLGLRRSGGGGGGGIGARASQMPRRQLKRSASKQRLARSRSRSTTRTNLRRANSKTNLRRTNSKGNLNMNMNRGGRDLPPPQQQRINRNINRNTNRLRSSSLRRKRSSSVNGRIGRQNTANINLSRRRLSQNNGINNGQGMAPFRRRNSTGNVVNKSGPKQGRISRPRGRRGSIQQQQQRGGRSRSRNRIQNRSVQVRRGSIRNSAGGGRGNNQRGRGRRGRSQVREGRAQNRDIKKEDLDKELDQYMANTKSALDKEMDFYMTGSNT